LTAERGGGVTGEPNIEPNVKVAKLLVFNRKAGKVGDFITAYRLFLKMKMREVTVEE